MSSDRIEEIKDTIGISGRHVLTPGLLSGATCYGLTDEVSPYFYSEVVDEILPEDYICSDWMSSTKFQDSICADWISSTKCQLEITDTDGARSSTCQMDLSLVHKDIITVENNNTDVKFKDKHFNHGGKNDALPCTNCIRNVITVGFCESLHCLQPTELNLRVKGSVSCEESLGHLEDCSNLLKEGSLEHAFLGNDNRTRLLFQVISFKFDEAIKCVQVELSDGSEFSSNCIFSQTLTNQIQSHINLWSIIEVLEYDIIADKFIEVKRFEVRQGLSRMIGDPDPIEDGLFLKIHRGDFRTCACTTDQIPQPKEVQTQEENPPSTNKQMCSEISKRNRKSQKNVSIKRDQGESNMDGNHPSSVLIIQHDPCSKNNINNEQISAESKVVRNKLCQKTNMKECYVRLEMNAVGENIEAKDDKTKLKKKPQAKSCPRHKCQYCDYEVINKCHLKTHIDAEHFGIRYFCDQCPYEAKAKRLVQRHFKSTHDGIRFKCDKCDYQGKRKFHLKRHIKSVHSGSR